MPLTDQAQGRGLPLGARPDQMRSIPKGDEQLLPVGQLQRDRFGGVHHKPATLKLSLHGLQLGVGEGLLHELGAVGFEDSRDTAL
ncbi:MAG: hypothetical protein NZV61_00575 [Candidatus Bipolaricaulota bacterium]|nr:hypothetical protein [Candidatus Bipolaricaulota bacterium]